MTRTLLLLGLLLPLAACAPRQTQPAELPVTPKGETEYAQLIRPFETPLAEMGVSVRRAQVWAYEGKEAGAFQQATRRFYRVNPGFCPVNGGFLAAEDRPVYVTLAARGTDVRGFVYDQTNRPQLMFAYFEGVSREAFAVSPCDNSTTK